MFNCYYSRRQRKKVGPFQPAQRGANTGATDARSYTALQIFVKRISYNVLGGFIFCRTGSTYDCLMQLTYLTRAQSKKAEPEAPQDIMFEDIAVLHPGEEVDLAFAAR